MQTITHTPRLEATVFKKLTLAAAAGAGYVLGAKAGKERYNQIESKFREIAGMPAVQNATQTVKEQASSVADTAKDKVGSGSSSSPSTSAVGTESLDEEVVVVDLGTGANTGSTLPGSTYSDTV